MIRLVAALQSRIENTYRQVLRSSRRSVDMSLKEIRESRKRAPPDARVESANCWIDAFRNSLVAEKICTSGRTDRVRVRHFLSSFFFLCLSLSLSLSPEGLC